MYDPETLEAVALEFWRHSATTGDAEALEKAITLFEIIVAATPTDHPEGAERFSMLSATLHDRFEQAGNAADLDRSITLGEESVATAAPNHPERAVMLSRLGVALRDRFLRDGVVADLDRAIAAGEEASAATPSEHPERAATLTNLGLSLRARFERLGAVADLDRAIAVGEEAVAATSTDNPNRAGRLSNLGRALGTRFEWMGSLADLDRSITVCEEAVAATPSGHPNRARYLSNLGGELHNRFVRLGSVDDLDRAVTVCEEAVAATPTGHREQSGRMSNLGAALHARFGRVGAMPDLDRAIILWEGAVAATPSEQPSRVTYLSNLGQALQTRFGRVGAAADLDRAITVCEETVAATPKDHPDRAADLLNLGIALEARFNQLGKATDYERAEKIVREAAQFVLAPSDVRARAARQWGRLEVERGNWDEAVEGFALAVRLEALVAPRSLARADQEYRLGELSGLGEEAAAAAVQAGHVDAAVELFELGRGVLFAQVLDARSDLTDLQNDHPELAAEFVQLRDELDRLARPSRASVPSADEAAIVAARIDADRRRQAAAAFDQVIEKIRKLPRFERFLLPPRVADLLPAAAGGPLVLINVAELRSDALILTSAGTDFVPLPKLTPATVIDQVNAFLLALDQAQNPGSSFDLTTRETAERRLGEVLGWLWDRITSPVLDRLELTAKPAASAKWPRVWWCPAGPLAIMPLHAAGHHETRFAGQPETVVDRIISSSTPTVRALLHSRQAQTKSDRGQLLVVAMPETPDQPSLPGAMKEAALLAELFPSQVDVVGLPDTPPAIFDTVTAALPTHRWAHFACHGASELNDPSTSHLLLTDYKKQPLTVLDLTHARLENAELAYLSACTTARIGVSLPDEPIHLAAACQLAGYKHVIATLWPISDADATRITRHVYTTLTGNTGQPEAGRAAVALHNATRRLRLLYSKEPSRWAAYTHTGP